MNNLECIATTLLFIMREAQHFLLHAKSKSMLESCGSQMKDLIYCYIVLIIMKNANHTIDTIYTWLNELCKV